MEAAIRIKAKDNRDLLDSIEVALVQIQQALNAGHPDAAKRLAEDAAGLLELYKALEG